MLEGWVANDIDLLQVLLVLVAASPTVALRVLDEHVTRNLELKALTVCSAP